MPLNYDITPPHEKARRERSHADDLLIDEAGRTLTEAGRRYIDYRLGFGELLTQCLPIAGAIYAEMHPAAQKYINEKYHAEMEDVRISPVKSWFFKAEDSFKTVRWNGLRRIVVPTGYCYYEGQPTSYSPKQVLLTLSDYDRRLKAEDFDGVLKEEREGIHHPSLLNTVLSCALKNANGHSEALRNMLFQRRWLVDYELDYEELLAEVIAKNRNS